jgi:hypothetical protein
MIPGSSMVVRIRLLTENFKSNNSFLWRQLTASEHPHLPRFLSPMCPQSLPCGSADFRCSFNSPSLPSDSRHQHQQLRVRPGHFLDFRDSFLQALAGETRPFPSKRPGAKPNVECPSMFCQHVENHFGTRRRGVRIVDVAGIRGRC